MHGEGFETDGAGVDGAGTDGAGTGAYGTDGFEVDADRLASRAAQFEPLVGRVDTIHRALNDALSSGPCWGTDAVGQSFGAVHTTPADDALTRLSGLSGRLNSVSTRLTETAGTYKAVDQSAIGHLKSAEQ